ncbi:MAG: tetratricopeptide repeat protein [Pyrinomonadaceae bacterium]|nr:tetratricopeptide repeat protein [Pyrinomonadaceae bacterium]
MIKELRIFKYGLIISLLSSPVVALGQDLGSSSGLFNNPKTKTVAKTAPKKTIPKPKRTGAVNKKTTPKPAVRTARNSNKPKIAKKRVEEKPLIAVKQPTLPPILPPSNAAMVITVGDKSGGDYDEFFEKAIEDGNSARDQRQYTKAEAAYLRAQSVKIKDSRAIYGLGNLYSDQQRWEEAERAYRTAIEIEPTAPEAYIALSFVLTQPIMGGDLADRYTEAEKLARRAIGLDPKNAFGYDQLGVALELGGGISVETQTAYRQAIALEPTFALAYAHLGRLLRKTGSIKESTAAYRSAIEYSTDVPTMILVADVMQSQQKYQDSEELLRRALKEDERNPTALYLLGRALTTRGSYEEAEKVLKKSADVSPNSFVSYTLLGSMFMRREKYDEAEKYLMRAVRVVTPFERKRLAQEFEAVGDGYSRTGKNKDAARVFRQAFALDKAKAGLADKLAKAEAN